jgi:hypothetical protein
VRDRLVHDPGGVASRARAARWNVLCIDPWPVRLGQGHGPCGTRPRARDHAAHQLERMRARDVVLTPAATSSRTAPGDALRQPRRPPPTPRSALDRTTTAAWATAGSGANGPRDAPAGPHGTPFGRPRTHTDEAAVNRSAPGGWSPPRAPRDPTVEPAVFGFRNHPSGPLFRYYMAFDEGPPRAPLQGAHHRPLEHRPIEREPRALLHLTPRFHFTRRCGGRTRPFAIARSAPPGRPIAGALPTPARGEPSENALAEPWWPVQRPLTTPGERRSDSTALHRSAPRARTPVDKCPSLPRLSSGCPPNTLLEPQPLERHNTRPNTDFQRVASPLSTIRGGAYYDE